METTAIEGHAFLEQSGTKQQEQKDFLVLLILTKEKINKSSTDVTLAYMKRNVALCFMRGYFYVQKEQQSNMFELDYGSFFSCLSFPAPH